MPPLTGTKVATGPQSRVPIVEPIGEVLSDSLAADSIESGGDFAKGQSASPMMQSSRGTTSNVTDTRSATKLNAAPDSESRGQQQGRGDAQRTLNRAIGERKDAGRGPTYKTTGGAAGVGGASGSGSCKSDLGNGAPAPSYAAGLESDDRPHGKNLKAGEFEGNEPNTSYTTDIGGEGDPGRQALGGMQGRNACAAEEVQTDTRGMTGGAYDALDEVQS